MHRQIIVRRYMRRKSVGTILGTELFSVTINENWKRGIRQDETKRNTTDLIQDQ